MNAVETAISISCQKNEQGKSVYRTGVYGKGEQRWQIDTNVKPKYSPEEILKRVEKIKNVETYYNVITDNCEHIARLVIEGEYESKQINKKSFITQLIANAPVVEHGDKSLKGNLQKELEFAEPTDAIDDVGKAMNFAKSATKNKDAQIAILTEWMRKYFSKLAKN